MRAAYVLLSFVVAFGAVPALAEGHGPVFGLATPTNSKGEWSFDLGVKGSYSSLGTEANLRSTVTYGFTPHTQFSITIPGSLSTTELAPARIVSGDFEATVGWRFHRNALGVGKRLESTVYGGLIVPGPQRPGGILGELKRAPGFSFAAATGMASRSHYAWGGAGYVHFPEHDGDRRPGVFHYSLVYGYRPAALRTDYPHWDWRLFVEMTGERWNQVRFGGAPVSASDGHQLFLGPATLGIYKSFAVQGGVQFPVYRDVGSLYAREKFRFAINVSYFLFRSHTGHDKEKP